jgi:hypothetical protein
MSDFWSQERITDYLDDRLSPEDRQQVEDYLRKHPQDAETLRDFRQIGKDLRNSRSYRLDDEFSQRVLAAIGQLPATDHPAESDFTVLPAARPRPAARARMWRYAAGLVTALAAMLLVAVIFNWRAPRTRFLSSNMQDSAGVAPNEADSAIGNQLREQLDQPENPPDPVSSQPSADKADRGHSATPDGSSAVGTEPRSVLRARGARGNPAGGDLEVEEHLQRPAVVTVMPPHPGSGKAGGASPETADGDLFLADTMEAGPALTEWSGASLVVVQASPSEQNLARLATLERIFAELPVGQAADDEGLLPGDTQLGMFWEKSGEQKKERLPFGQANRQQVGRGVSGDQPSDPVVRDDVSEPSLEAGQMAQPLVGETLYFEVQATPAELSAMLDQIEAEPVVLAEAELLQLIQRIGKLGSAFAGGGAGLTDPPSSLRRGRDEAANVDQGRGIRRLSQAPASAEEEDQANRLRMMPRTRPSAGGGGVDEQAGDKVERAAETPATSDQRADAAVAGVPDMTRRQRYLLVIRVQANPGQLQPAAPRPASGDDR